MNLEKQEPQPLYHHTKRKNSNGDGAINFRSDCNKWRVRVTINGKRCTIGTFAEKDDAEACLSAYVDSLPMPEIDSDLERIVMEIEASDNVRCIRTTKRQLAVVDIADFPLLSGLKWHACWADHTQSYYPKCAWYDPTKKNNQRHVLMSRMIMGVLDNPSVWVDHIDHDTMNHRRSNLRLANKKQSAHNRRIRRSSGLKWTTLRPNGKWLAQITADGKLRHLGEYNTTEEAHAVSKAMALILHVDFACSETIIKGESK